MFEGTISEEILIYKQFLYNLYFSAKQTLHVRLIINFVVTVKTGQ